MEEQLRAGICTVTIWEQFCLQAISITKPGKERSNKFKKKINFTLRMRALRRESRQVAKGLKAEEGNTQAKEVFCSLRKSYRKEIWQEK